MRLILVLLATSLLGCRQMSEEGYRAYLTDAHQYLTARQAELERVYQLSSYAHYQYDQRTGQLVFSDSGVVKVIADSQFVGDVSSRDSTWLWAWDNESVSPSLATGVSRLRWLGWRRGIGRLRNAHWPADQIDGWEMTAIAAKELGAQGAYRAPDDRGYTFLVLDKVRWAPPGMRIVEIE